MNHRIERLDVVTRRLDPAEAEVLLTVVPQQATLTTEVRGRLMGPRCLYASTVEVAYPLREASREGRPHETLRVVIPEPCWWDPQSPFLYEGPVELWQDGQCCARVEISHGLRSLSLGAQGVRWNGRLLFLQGVARSAWQDEEARQLHHAGVNTLLVPATLENQPIWAKADRFGFLVLGQLRDRQALLTASALSRHVSCLGWVVAAEGAGEVFAGTGLPPELTAHGQLLGMEVGHDFASLPPAGVQFLVCPEALLSAVAQVPLPKLVVGQGDRPANGSGAAAGTGQLLGWIRQ